MKLSWLPRRMVAATPAVNTPTQTTNQERDNPPPSRITVSLLTFSDFDRCIALLLSLCPLLAAKAETLMIAFTVVVRNNNPRLDSATFDATWSMLRESYPSIQFMLFNEGFNVGFGVGHNLNFDAAPRDYFLILNDDLSFTNLDWLDEGLAIIKQNDRVGAVGAQNNPSSVSPAFINGTFSRNWHRWPLRYVEASIMLVRADIFNSVGKFDDSYQWAMCEDSDLSFRIQSHGYKLEWINIDHVHWRSSSFNILPDSVKSSILEHNRATLSANWNVAIAENKIGSLEIFDLQSAGIGDVFCAAMHLKAYLDTRTVEQRSRVVVNTSAAELASLILGDGVIIETLGDRFRLAAKYASMGVRSFKSLNGVNYGLPFNIHSLVCAVLGIPVASPGTLATVLNGRRRPRETSPVVDALRAPYCVLHLESERADHDGRAPSALTQQQIAMVTAQTFQHIVLIGKRKTINESDIVKDNGNSLVTDLQGQLSISALLDVISGADAFVGIDSFPAHVAQIATVRSAIFFGSVHPTFRVLSEGPNWPIVQPLDCIGCYHTLLDPAIPFCMRRDLACTKNIPLSIIKTAIEGCAHLEGFDWRVLAAQALELQRKFFMQMFFHPAPERRFFNTNGLPNEMASNLVYGIIEQTREALLSVGQFGTIKSMIRQIDETHQRAIGKDVQIESMIKLISDLRKGY